MPKYFRDNVVSNYTALVYRGKMYGPVTTSNDKSFQPRVDLKGGRMEWREGVHLGKDTIWGYWVASSRIIRDLRTYIQGPQSVVGLEGLLITNVCLAEKAKISRSTIGEFEEGGPDPDPNPGSGDVQLDDEGGGWSPSPDISLPPTEDQVIPDTSTNDSEHGGYVGGTVTNVTGEYRQYSRTGELSAPKPWTIGPQIREGHLFVVVASQEKPGELVYMVFKAAGNNDPGKPLSLELITTDRDVPMWWDLARDDAGRVIVVDTIESFFDNNADSDSIDDEATADEAGGEEASVTAATDTDGGGDSDSGDSGSNSDGDD